jgi:thiosulfate/3-mercaptopyruvate sulfurtransferase
MRIFRRGGRPMHWQTLIDAASLRDALGDPRLVVLDCRFDLSDPASGEREWRAGHVPGSHHADLDRDLSDLSRHGRGRHPLPAATDFCTRLVHWGVTPDHQVVALDAGAGMFAARLWWMLRLLGHRDAAVLDGGLAAWQAAGGALDAHLPATGGGQYQADFDSGRIVTTAELETGDIVRGGVLLDARAGPRFRGEIEPLDPRAGHVPGARNHPFQDNLGADGRFLPAAQLRSMFERQLDGCSPAAVVHMCGSGVTACHNLLAMEHAGLSGSRVYAGSWSEWVSTPAHPVATGEA